MSGSPLTIWKRDDHSHPPMIVGHAAQEIQTVTREINHLAYILDVDESRVEWANMQGQRHLQPLSAARITLQVLWLRGNFPVFDRGRLFNFARPILS